MQAIRIGNCDFSDKLNHDIRPWNICQVTLPVTRRFLKVMESASRLAPFLIEGGKHPKTMARLKRSIAR